MSASAVFDSDVRYEPVLSRGPAGNWIAEMEQWPQGRWVALTTAQFEIERLREMIDGKLLEDRDYLLAENDRLRAQLDAKNRRLEEAATLLAMVAVHKMHSGLGGLCEEQELAIQEWYENCRQNRVGETPHRGED